MRYLLFLLSLVFLSCNDNLSEIQRWEQRAHNITIIRDDFGVPHIYGKTDADAVFGMLYAQCEDDFPRVERNYIWAIGRLAEVDGEEALYSDLRARMFMTVDEAKANYAQSPDWLKDLCNAFADGINYYLYTHPEVQPELLTRFEPWMPMYFSEGSIGGDIERVSTRRIKAFYEEEILSVNEFGDGLTHPDFEEEPVGSNGIAIAGTNTASGNAMLLINPHTSFYFRGETHMVSEEGLNAYGAVTWGQFFIYQGFNEHTGWMHTSTYTDVIDEFVEDIQESEQGIQYVFGDDLKPVEAYEVTLKFKTTDGDFQEKTFPFYRTHHGPITHSLDGEWVATAMMWSPAKALEQSFIRTKQSGLEGFNEMMGILTNSSNNTVYADSDGNIAYYHGNFIPKRDPTLDYSKPVDGSDPATDWQGLHPVDEAITVFNPPNGWIQNCNSTPFTAAATYSPKRGYYPKYMSIDRENFRGIHAIRLLSKIENLTLDGLIELAYEPTLPGFETMIPGLVQAYDELMPSDADISTAIEALRNWDFRVSKESVAMTLAHFYGMECLRNGNIPDSLSGIERYNYFGKDAPIEDRLKLFEATITKLEDDFGNWKMPWGTVNRFQRLSGDIDLKYDDQQPSLPIGMASGRWGALASYGSRAPEGTKKLYGSSGNSFVAVVEFGERVHAKSLLAGGQSNDPQSPHFDDQAQRYADGQFKEVAFYREDVEARADKTYHPGNTN